MTGIEQEFTSLIVAIVDVLYNEGKALEKERDMWQLAPFNIERMAKLAEIRIRLSEIKKLKKQILSLLKKSTNNLIIASIPIEEN